MKAMKLLVQKKYLTKKVIFTGKSDILEILSISNIFVLTSLQEGLPKSIMEAMSIKNLL